MIYFVWDRVYLFGLHPAREIYVKTVPVGAGAVFIFEAMIIIAILNVVSLV